MNAHTDMVPGRGPDAADSGTRTRCPACQETGAAPWASARDVEYRSSDEEFAFYRCARCGVLFLDPMPVDRLAEIYPANYYAYASDEQSFAHRVKDRLDALRLRRILSGLTGGELKVLDVGGGDGWQLDVIRGLDSRVSFTQVVDLDPAAQERAVARGHRFFCGRVEDFSTEERFDLILLINLIEHVSDPGEVLRTLGRHLTPQGVILIKTPNTDSMDARLFRHRDWGGYHCPRHWVLFDRRNFTRLAHACGFTVSRFSYTQGAPFWSTSILAALARRGWVTVTAERPMTRHPLFPILAAGFAGFDLARQLLGGRPSQMFVELVPARGSARR
ncbi:methyltransferase domain-containing protein [Nonomuraea sp. SMC257]|uniref:Methyltransferase domain-containing protein n=1 Tax=Nonomuraea montanisoli TaxID=2741721 RepID=A0A7Y6IF19_9ACTN|nr:methyltransferase domain-containing protein [Nonomuraea montanisoli]NUW36458.1 methyltransferase domain-containing protein [Nonomuraea montanisoli]